MRIPKASKKWCGAAVVVLATFAALLLADYFLYPATTIISGHSHNSRRNGLWLRYLWYFGRKTPAEFSDMAQLLTREQIRFAYFHIRDMNKNGSLTYHYREQARKLTDFVHTNAPNVQAIAWVYVGSSDVDVGSAAVRSKMVDDAKWLCGECGFDGVQWDYEFAPNGDTRLLELLSDTKRGLPANKLVAVATPMMYPFTLWGWNEQYTAEVASRCDQLAVMCYDSFFYLPRAYVWLVARQAVQFTSTVSAANPACRVVLGIPTYDEGTAGHSNQSETISMALKGVREGLDDNAAKRDVFDGVAPFAEYTTTPDEWRVYDKYWLSN